jgi:hypothetical protein
MFDDAPTMVPEKSSARHLATQISRMKEVSGAGSKHKVALIVEKYVEQINGKTQNASKKV